MLQQLGLHRDWRYMPALLRAMTNRCDAPQRQPDFVEQVKRRSVQLKELGHLPQRAVNGVGEIQGLRKSLANGVQHHQFAIAPPDFLLGSLAVGYVQQKTL